MLWGAQAASLFIPAACRNAPRVCQDVLRCVVAGKLPATTGQSRSGGMLSRHCETAAL
jgi:hypothetical protein